MQNLFYIVSPLITLFAVLIAFIALMKQSRPHVVVYLLPHRDVGSYIELAVSNIGTGTARSIEFSVPIPLLRFGIDKPDPSDVELNDPIPVMAPGQTIRYTAGQFAGLANALGSGLEVVANYKYRNALQLERKGEDTSLLTVSHLSYMAGSGSAENTLIDALKGKNNTVFYIMNGHLQAIAAALSKAEDPHQICKR